MLWTVSFSDTNVILNPYAHMQMPTTIEELDAAIQDNISQANSILFLNQNVLKEYEHRQEKVIFEIHISFLLSDTSSS